MDTSSDCTTKGIRVQVFPEFLPKENYHYETNYLFQYKVIISNHGDRNAKLLSRHWIIIDSEGNREDVEGEGVVGYTPELKPGETFTYSSYCPLDTAWGTMEGSYKMIRDDGTMFEAKIERFYLLSPDAENTDE